LRVVSRSNLPPHNIYYIDANTDEVVASVRGVMVRISLRKNKKEIDSELDSTFRAIHSGRIKRFIRFYSLNVLRFKKQEVVV